MCEAMLHSCCFVRAVLPSESRKRRDRDEPVALMLDNKAVFDEEAAFIWLIERKLLLLSP